MQLFYQSTYKLKINDYLCKLNFYVGSKNSFQDGKNKKNNI
jgi:hypothetical protein